MSDKSRRSGRACVSARARACLHVLAHTGAYTRLSVRARERAHPRRVMSRSRACTRSSCAFGVGSMPCAYEMMAVRTVGAAEGAKLPMVCSRRRLTLRQR